MALVAGNKVFLSIYGLPSGLMADPPLLGVVDKIDGTAPDLVRVVWENGATSFFQSTNEVTVGLSIVTAISLAGAGAAASAFGHDGILLATLTVSGVAYKLVFIRRTAFLDGFDKYALVAA